MKSMPVAIEMVTARIIAKIDRMKQCLIEYVTILINRHQRDIHHSEEYRFSGLHYQIDKLPRTSYFLASSH